MGLLIGIVSVFRADNYITALHVPKETGNKVHI